MRPDQARDLAHATMGYIRQLDHAETAGDVKRVMDAFVPWAKASGVAPQIRAHVAMKAREIHSEIEKRQGGRPSADRKSAASGPDRRRLPNSPRCYA